MPVCVEGASNSSGHAWVFDGLSAITTDGMFKIDKILAIHCNWGWGGLGNGWYDGGAWYTPKDQTTFEPLSDGAYYRNNGFIYFKWTRR